MTETADLNTCPPADSQPVDDRPPINAEWLARMRTTKPEFLAKLFEVFLADEPGRIASLGEAVARGDLDMTRYLAHSLKGAAATLGMERLRDCCRELEYAARNGQAKGLAAQCARVRREIETVYEVMRESGPAVTRKG